MKTFKKILNIDSRHRKKEFQLSTNFDFELDSQIKNIISIKLFNIEIPNTYYNISKKNKNTNFNIIMNNNINEIIIEDGNYNINDIIKTINKKFNKINNKNNKKFNIKINKITNKITITNNKIFKLDFTKNHKNRKFNFGLGYNLGYKYKIYNNSNQYEADNIYILKDEEYFLLSLNCYQEELNLIDSYVEGNGKLNENIFAKIFMKSNKMKTNVSDFPYYISEKIEFKKPINIMKFKIKIINSYGEIVDLQGHEISLTIELTIICDSKLACNLINNY
jgi:hypothetical protein